ncbi:MAG: phosphoenolpyruvate kinase [Candidatus Eisenbacteria bacterium]|uniref:Phosphoenolpyruvate kinase n=1 Tax=Eiseniibacteriota bacterium TaxID=2212470 RepID=A0A849SIY0_UNCEI|nr:phosphoenolpyruvate kinase [Candidatus Eisenbacteria bacterium]
MRTVIRPEHSRDLLARLAEANQKFAAMYPGDRLDRQPVHTVYGGAQLFTADTTRKLGAVAVRTLEEYAPDAATLARAVGLEGDSAFQRTVYERVRAKLEHDPIEDFRIDFEDGYGFRPDAEEDHDAVRNGEEVARGMQEQLLPGAIGIRIKPYTEELHLRSIRTLDLFLSTLLAQSGGKLPSNFCVTLPKITSPAQVEAFVGMLAIIEREHGLVAGSIPIELMVETTLSIFDAERRVALPALIAAAGGRVRGAHFGTYDYTANCNITARHQQPQHPACDFARHVMQVSLAGTGVTLSDGATTVMPVGPHRAAAGQSLTSKQLDENRRAVHHGWRVHFDDVRSSLRHAYYQGWDLNPAQLPSRYAAVFSFFLESRAEAAARLRAFVDKAAQATLLGQVFDDAATGQGLLNFFLRGLSCGAITEDEALATGVTLEEFHGRSFVKMLKGRDA